MSHQSTPAFSLQPSASTLILSPTFPFLMSPGRLDYLAELAVFTVVTTKPPHFLRTRSGLVWSDLPPASRHPDFPYSSSQPRIVPPLACLRCPVPGPTQPQPLLPIYLPLPYYSHYIPISLLPRQNRCSSWVEEFRPLLHLNWGFRCLASHLSRAGPAFCACCLM